MSASTGKILKALSIFGGVQVLGILCSIIRTKLVAIWLGPLGVGLISIYNQIIDLFTGTTQLNLRQSAVRDISLQRDTAELPHTLGIVRVLALILGIGGMVLLILCSPLVSAMSFGNSSHTLAVALLSPILLLSAVSAGEQAIMQGREQLKVLARSSLYAAVTSTLLSLPLFYFLRTSGIIPVLLIFALSTCAYSLYFGGGYRTCGVGIAAALREGRPMLSLGAYLTVSSIVSTLATYLFIAYLNNRYDTSTVGYYQAGYTIINSYVGLIFTSISMEYYPRLSATIKSARRTATIVSHEMSVAIWVLIPLGVCFVCFRELIVSLLYTSEFKIVVPYITIGFLGVFMRAAAWCLGFVMVARGDGKAYILTECVSSAVYLAVNVPAFRYWGFEGLGAGFVIWYTVYLALTYGVYRLRYGMRLSRSILPLIIGGTATCGLAAWLCTVLGNWWTLLLCLPPALWLCSRRLMRKRT